MSRAPKYLAVSVIGALLLTAAQATAQTPNATAGVESDGAAPSPSAGPAAPALQDDAPASVEGEEASNKGAGRGSCGVESVVIAGEPPLVADAPLVARGAQPEPFQFSVDASAVRAGGWLLAIVGLGAALTGIAAPLASGPSHLLRGGNQTVSPSWAAPLAIGGGAAMIGGVAIVASCGPMDPDGPAAHGAPDRTFGLRYDATF